MKQTNQQPLDVYYLDKNPKISWKNSYDNHVFDWNSYQNEQEEYRIPIIESSPSPKSDRSYCFDKKKRSSKYIVIQEPPINDYFKASLFSCLICFWMIAGIICLIQSIKIRR